ncbi:TonB-dependent receptor [Tenacibaculum maritimum]|uniref:TonB-dependent receptor n=1 Tax=Tenacibaculum maritimum TaxID=107401 RepID=UPI0010A2E0F2|nr:TonB-dependent receptor plug domain-containing protein [Tenacibaculum maritimum]QCD63607.1 hypothetical protein B9C57_14195 [Tenacibaculum maritimum]
MKKSTFVIVLILFTNIIIAQKTVTGFVKDSENKPLWGVDITLKNATIGTLSNEQGYFKLEVPEDAQFLEFSYMGFDNKTISIKKQFQNLYVNLIDASISLDDIQVNAKSKVEIIKEKTYDIAVLSEKSLKNSSVDLNTALKGLSGINVRSNGGLGSSFEFSMNGLSGKQIKFFIDNIPMENLGYSMTLNNFPPNLIQRVEIYKGVVPIYLGSDALGGAINIITKQKKSDYLDVSYSLGSFNTHIASFLGQYYDSSNGFVAKFSSFYNYSDNNYKIDDINVNDEFGNNLGTIDDVERFHDAYQSNMIRLQVGVFDKKIINRLLLGATFSSNRDEIQHALDPQKPYGNVLTKENLQQTSINYTSKGILKDKLSINLYASLTKRTSKLIDTVSKIYYWYKPAVSQDLLLPLDLRRGEVDRYKSLFTLYDNSHSVNSYLNYKITAQQQLNLNYNKNYLTRKGANSIAQARVPFTIPHILDKNILGISYDVNLFDNSLKSSLFAKYFNLSTEGTLSDPFKNESDPDKYQAVKNSFDKLGFGLALTYSFHEKLRGKISFERALRLPEGYELLGNGNFLLPNLTLLPELSNNYNIGFIFNNDRNNSLRININANGFYRDVKNLILLRNQAIYSKYLNKKNGKIIGAESSININYKNWLFSFNATKQGITELNDKNESIKTPNIPLTFSNIKFAYTFNHFLRNNHTLTCSWNARYVDKYPLNSYVEGALSTREIIPEQFSQNIALTYSTAQKKYNISFSIRNITDQKLYDNFKIQQPGRAYQLKLRYGF